jgi:hypothetical protein
MRRNRGKRSTVKPAGADGGRQRGKLVCSFSFVVIHYDSLSFKYPVPSITMAATAPDEQTLLLGTAPYSHVEGTSSKNETVVEPQRPTSSDNYANNLIRYREAVGISSTYGDNADLETARRGASGLYKEIIDLQRSRTKQYRAVNFLYYFALALQVLMGALLSSLGGQAELHKTAITVFGVLNASLAGILALLKGQGLPDRFRKDEYNLRLVQDFIEETDMRLAIRGNDITRAELQRLVEQVFEKYHTARDQAAASKPNSFPPRRTAVPQIDGANGQSNRNSSDKGKDVKGKRRFGFERTAA